jgi:hypothetical protein
MGIFPQRGRHNQPDGAWLGNVFARKWRAPYCRLDALERRAC